MYYDIKVNIMKTIFDTFEKLPVNIFMTYISDKGTGRVFNGRIVELVPNTREYIDRHELMKDAFMSEGIESFPETQSLLITDKDTNMNYLFNSFINTLVFVVSHEFITSYLNGFEIVVQSNN